MDPSQFGFDRPPFDNTPNPAHFVNLAGHRQAIETLLCAVEQRKGLVLVTGAPGTGKTLAGRMLKHRCGVHAAVAVVARPCTGAADLWAAILDGFRLGGNGSANPAQELERYAEALYEQDVPVVLIVEDAHDLPDECLDLLRRLAAIEADDMPLIQIVLIGWPKLAARFLGLAGAAMQQRVWRHVKMGPLGEADTLAYIRGRIRLAGGPEEDLFTEDAMRVVHRRTGGIPRLINWLCDALLNEAAEAHTGRIDADRAEAIAFEMSYDPELFEAQLAADEAGVVLHAQLQNHPVIRSLLDRLAQAEAGVAQAAAETAQLREREPEIARTLRRYDRIFERMLPLLRSLQGYRRESEAMLAACREACGQLERMLQAPESTLNEARRRSEEVQQAAEGMRELIAQARGATQEMRQQVVGCEDAVRRITTERDATLPVMRRTRRMIGLLRRIHHLTHERCERLDELAARAHGLCEELPARLAEMEKALVEPARMLEQMRATEALLRQHVEAGERQRRNAQQTIEQAVYTARKIRAEIQRTRAEEKARGPASAEAEDWLSRHGATGRSLQAMADDLLRRAREPETSAHPPTPDLQSPALSVRPTPHRAPAAATSQADMSRGG